MNMLVMLEEAYAPVMKLVIRTAPTTIISFLFNQSPPSEVASVWGTVLFEAAGCPVLVQVRQTEPAGVKRDDLPTEEEGRGCRLLRQFCRKTSTGLL